MSRLLVTLLAALSIVAIPLSTGAAAKTMDIYQLAQQNVTVTNDGFFAIQNAELSRSDSARLHGVFDPLNAQLANIERALRPTIGQPATKVSARSATSGGKLAALAASFCGYVPRWAFEAFAWYVMIVGVSSPRSRCLSTRRSSGCRQERFSVRPASGLR